MRLIQKLALIVIATAVSISAQSMTMKVLGEHVPYSAMASAVRVGQLAANTPMNLTVVLNLRNTQALQTLVSRLYNPNDPMYEHYLTPQEFRAEFGPTRQDFAQVEQYLNSHNLRIIRETTNTVQFQGTSADVESAFGVQMQNYLKPNGTLAYAPSGNPQVASQIAPEIAGVLGLNTFSHFTAHYIKRQNTELSQFQPFGSGPNGGLSPSDIQTAYSLANTGATGAGQTLALMELDGYNPSDISTYAQTFNIGSTPALQNILVDGYNGSAGSGADEVTLDIELMIAVAHSASKILVYEGPNTETGPIDVYSKIADDDIAKEISTSWGSPESQNTQAFLNSENTIFEQMAAQGQTIYAASGDSGAYDNGSTLGVDDPASQPYVVAAGGTTLNTATNGSYISESSWGIPASPQNQLQGGGGGISSVWPIPSWQTGVATSLNKGSTTMRMVPDVSVEANPQTGYAIYVGGSWGVFGGTSCAAPIWAGFTALVNQARASKGLSPLGFADPTLYKLGESSAYTTLFHDIADDSTNLFYPAVSGYDLSTGWGSMVGPNLLSALVGSSVTPAPTPTPTPAPSVPPTPTNLTVVSVTPN